MKYTNIERCTDLFARFEDVALEGVAASVAGNVAKNFQIVAIVGDVEYPGTIKSASKPLRYLCTSIPQT